jgi:hypothetical protein
MAAPVARAADKDRIKQAIERGVTYVKALQRDDGSWPYQESGMTSLAALTLIECGIPTTDTSIQRAAAFVRNDIIDKDRTYSVALAVMFLDRLGEDVDVALIEALGARLLSGQFANGGWTYKSGTDLIANQKTRLKEAVMRRVDKKERSAPTTEERRAPTDINPDTKAEIENITKRGPIAGDNLGGGVGGLNGEMVQRPDNSNTQFAVLGLWIARRYGIPVQDALDRVEKRFRGSQNGDGGWGYMPPSGNRGNGPVFEPNAATTSAMTCAGLIGLAMHHAAAGESTMRAGRKGKDGDTKTGPKQPTVRDIARDPTIAAALNYLSAAMAAAPATRQPPPDQPRGGLGPGVVEPPAGVRPGPKGKPQEGAPKGGARGGPQDPKDDDGPPKGQRGQAPGGPGGPQNPKDDKDGPPKGQRGQPPGGQFPPGFPGPGGQGPPGGFPGPGGQQPRGGFQMPTKNLMAMGRVYYFLWSLERAAVAYGLQKIGGKDWYDWGANFLLGDQEKDGSWQGIHGSYGADTCFALLFLRRADLAKDLSTALRGKMGESVLSTRRINESIKKVRSPFEEGGSGGDPNAGRTNPKESTTPKPPPANVDPVVAKLSAELVGASGAKWNDALAKLRDTRGAEHTQALAYAIGQLEGDQKKNARQALAERLAKLKVSFLATYMEDEDPELRRAGAAACALKEDTTHMGKLIDLLNDPERSVERAALWALKELSKQDFGPALNATDAEKAAAVKSWRDWWKKQAEK